MMTSALPSVAVSRILVAGLPVSILIFVEAGSPDSFANRLSSVLALRSTFSRRPVGNSAAT